MTKQKINILNIKNKILFYHHYINGDIMFNGYRILNSNYLYLFLDNNYEFGNDVNTREEKENKIKEECRKFINIHNLNFKDRLYFVSNGIVIGYINKIKLNE